MSDKYKTLRSPLVVGEKVIKSRFYFPNAMPKVLQGAQCFPDEPIVSFYTELARNGAAMICCSDFENRSGGFNENEKHFPFYDHSDPGTENALSMMAESVRFYGSLMGVDVGMAGGMNEYGVVDSEADDEPDPELLDGTVHIRMVREAKKQIGTEQMELMISAIAEKAKYYKNLGFGFVYIQPFSGVFGSFLNSKTNTRNDEYGGSLENRAKFPLEVFKQVKKAVGNDFIVVLDANNHLDPTLVAPYTYIPEDEAIEFFKMAEPYIDMINMRSKQIETPFDGTMEEYAHPESLDFSVKTKKAGFKKPIAVWTGFMELDMMEEAVASGKADMLCSARIMISNPEFGDIVKEGRGEDLTPCVKCNKCHGHTMTGPWVSVCTVNPEIGLQHKIDKLKGQPGSSKKIAVIGGGPAGVMASVYASRRGHKVTLFEASDKIGGQLIAASASSFKWPLKMYLEYLRRQAEKPDIDLRLKVRATPKMIKDEGFDVVIAALGGVERLPDIEITSGANVMVPTEVYGNEDKLGSTIVCVGGSETSVETALHLAQTGRKVKLLTRSNRLAHDSNPLHYATELRDACAANRNLSFITHAVTTRIDESGVTYLDGEGAEHNIECDNVIALGGLSPLQKEALSFIGAADQFYIIGDCESPGNVQLCVRQAYAAASAI